MSIEISTPTGPPVDLSGLEEIKQHLEGILISLEEMPPIPADAMSYSEVKMQLMINYIANLSFYISLKMKGESVGDHPVFKHLAYLRTFMERLVPLDAALKYQIDKLLLEDSRNGEETTGSSSEPSTAPNLAAFVPSVASAVKKITFDQVKSKASDIDISLLQAGGSLEIDPSLIAAQIEKAQQRAATAASKPKTKTYVEQDSDISFDEEEEALPRKKNKKRQAKDVVDSDDEEIDSDFDL